MIRYIQGESGIALVAVMIVILLLTILGAGLLSSALLENKMIHRVEDQKQAFYLAQAGVEYSRFRLQKDLTWRTEGYNEDLGQGAYEVIVSEHGANNLKIISTGTVGKAKRTIEVGMNYSVAENNVIKELSTYSAVSGSDMTFTHKCYFYDMGNLRVNGNIKFYHDVSLDGRIILTGNVTEYRGQIVPSQVVKTDETYSVPQIDWDRLKTEAQTTGNYLSRWDANWDTSVKLVSGKVNYIEGSMTFNIPVNWDPNEDTILVIRGDWLVNHKANILSTKGLTIFVDGKVTVNSETELNAAVFASQEILINHKLTLHGAIYSHKSITSNHHTYITLDPIHLQQTVVEQVLISSTGGGDGKNTFNLMYWNED
jgi:hypothetical protein